MAISNRERVGKGLELLAEGLAPFVQRELKAHLGRNWEQSARDAQRGTAGEIHWSDPQVLLSVMWDQWNAVFRNSLGHGERSLTSEIRTARNEWAHNKEFSSDDTARALDSMGRLLSAVSAGDQAKEVNQIRMDLLRLVFDEQRRQEMRKKSFQPTEGKPQGGLKPWREVVTPHPDVASGKYQQAEFAADLWQVYQNEGSDEYKHPTEFFRRTFLTEGLTRLLTQAVRRLSGAGGDPVVELQTNFGGGKTHSMLALYHMFSGIGAGELPGIEDLIKEEGLTIPQNVRRAVFVGTQISPGKPHEKPDGTLVHTLWGEIAWQLGGKEGYAMVREDDERATNPGDTMKKVFDKFGPCLVLIDEWVAYARQLHSESDLPAGSFDTQFTFAQALSEAAKAAKHTLVVVSIPASEHLQTKGGKAAAPIEIGGEKGFEALERLKNAVGRVEASWRPANPDEGFEIVRRRLFQPLEGDKYVLRDAVARAYVDFYGQQQKEFPSECREADYERRIKMAYPIHPELFDRMYNDWSTLEKFQRTRGVLRLMATVIHSLWERNDSNLLIMPGTVPIDDARVQWELTRYLEDSWAPVIEKDVDGANSLPLALDRENPTLGRYSTCRRVARTIYMGSAPTHEAANRGIDERQVKLGCVQPGEAVPTFGDAIRRLTDRATYLYVDGKRYWYSTQQSVNRLAEDRAEHLHEADVEDEIKTRLAAHAKTKGDFARVHSCRSSGEIPDDPEVALVILGPEYAHRGKDENSDARREAAAILESRGASPRNFKNMLVFLAPDANRLRELEHAVRQFRAWDSINNEKEELNLDQFQSKQAATKVRSADETVESRIPETFQWLLVPGYENDDPKANVAWSEIRLQGQDALAKRASKKLKTEELLMPELGGLRLRHELDRVPLWRGDHVSLKQLCEDMAKYLYLPRLRDQDVLLAAVRDGVERITWESETFAYAEQYDEATGRYVGLRAGQTVRLVVDGDSVLVKPEVAARQRSEDAKPPEIPPDKPVGPTPGPTTPPVSPPVPPPPPEKKRNRFYGSVSLDPVRLGRDASRIADEVVRHLKAIVGAEVEVTLEIQATLPDGAPEKLVRDVTENCRTLKFTTQGFEEG